MSEFKLFRKKPVVIKAKKMDKAFTVKTKEGTMEGKKGDYLIIGIQGEQYPCDVKIFNLTYEKAQGIINMELPEDMKKIHNEKEKKK